MANSRDNAVLGASLQSFVLLDRALEALFRDTHAPYRDNCKHRESSILDL